MGGFKDMVAADRSAVFLDPEIFGEECRIEGKTVFIVLDNDELKKRQGGQDLAVAESATLFYARAEDLPPRRAPGASITVNGRFQSRQYLKIIENMPVHKTAYEVSMLDYE